MLGFGTTDFDNYQNRTMAIFVIVLFACLTIILLMNMLIAAMSETYVNLAPHKEQISIWNKIAAIMLIERKNLCAQTFKKKYLNNNTVKGKWVLAIETSIPPTCM